VYGAGPDNDKQATIGVFALDDGDGLIAALEYRLSRLRGLRYFAL